MNLSLTLPLFLMPILASLVSLQAVDAWIPASKLDQHLPVFAAQHEHDERRKNGRIATTATADRRQLLKAIWRNAVTTSTVALVDIGAISTPGRAWASSDGGDDKVQGLTACQIGNKKLKRKISDVREAVEMTVQASSVQAWPSAAESINDAILDESNLSSLLLESCASADKKQEAAIKEILRGVRAIRSKLANDKLATEDAMAIMSLGTTTRSNIDLLFDL